MKSHKTSLVHSVFFRQRISKIFYTDYGSLYNLRKIRRLINIMGKQDFVEFPFNAAFWTYCLYCYEPMPPYIAIMSGTKITYAQLRFEFMQPLFSQSGW